MSDTRQTDHRPIDVGAQAGTIAAAAPRNGRWVVLFVLFSSLLTYAEIRSEAGRLESRAAHSRLERPAAAVIADPGNLAAAAAIRPDGANGPAVLRSLSLRR